MASKNRSWTFWINKAVCILLGKQTVLLKFSDAFFYLALTLVSLSLRIPHLSPLAVIGPDGSEYIYCVEKNQLPHSPYILFLWMGYLLRLFIRLDWGYMALSLVSSLVSAILFGRVIERLEGNRYAGWIAASVFSLVPVSIRYAGIQEVYAVQVFLIVLAWWVLVVHSSFFGYGLVIGAAVMTHNGTVFALPSLLFLFGCRADFLTGPSHPTTEIVPRRHGLQFYKAKAIYVWEWIWEFTGTLKENLSLVRLSSIARRTLQAPVWEMRVAACVREEQAPFRNLVMAMVRTFLRAFQVFQACQPQWARLLAGFFIPVVIVMSWLVVIWIQGHGLSGFPLIIHFLRGIAPGPGLAGMFRIGWCKFVWIHGVMTWDVLTSLDGLGFIPLLMAALLLFLTPLRKSLVWWLLAIPYLFYESTIGISLDMGIYLVFVAPAVAAGFAFGIGCWTWSRKLPLNLIRSILCVIGLTGLVNQLPAFQATSEVRRLLPWFRETGSMKALSDWVRIHTPQDSLVIQPLEWHFAGMASALYTDRIPIYREGGGMLIPGLWKPLFCNKKFNHVQDTTTADFEYWLDTGRPILSLDADPFHTWRADWPGVDTSRYETRPILWLDRNQTGTSEQWRNIEVLASVNMGDATAEAPYHVEYSANRTFAVIQMPPYRPTLYRIARKIDPPEPPQWVKNLQALVPEHQRTPLPPRWDDGFSVKTEDGPISLWLPTCPGRDHVLKLTLQTIGWDYVAECQVKTGSGWVRTDRDMERIVGNPDGYFTELYLRVPARYVNETSLNVHLRPALGAPSLNCFQIEWGVDKG